MISTSSSAPARRQQQGLTPRLGQLLAAPRNARSTAAESSRRYRSARRPVSTLFSRARGNSSRARGLPAASSRTARATSGGIPGRAREISASGRRRSTPLHLEHSGRPELERPRPSASAEEDADRLLRDPSRREPDRLHGLSIEPLRIIHDYHEGSCRPPRRAARAPRRIRPRRRSRPPRPAPSATRIARAWRSGSSGRPSRTGRRSCATPRTALQPRLPPRTRTVARMSAACRRRTPAARSCRSPAPRVITTAHHQPPNELRQQPIDRPALRLFDQSARGPTSSAPRPAREQPEVKVHVDSRSSPPTHAGPAQRIASHTPRFANHTRAAAESAKPARQLTFYSPHSGPRTVRGARSAARRPIQLDARVTDRPSIPSARRSPSTRGPGICLL